MSKKELLANLKDQITHFEYLENLKMPILKAEDMNHQDGPFGIRIENRTNSNPLVHLYIKNEGNYYHKIEFDICHIKALDRICQQIKVDIELRTHGIIKEK